MAVKKAHNVSSNSLADFKQLSLLGEGAYSAVYKVLRLADREVYALKKVKLPSLSEKEKQNALNEVRLLASVRHENIVAYKEAFFDDKTRCLCIVMEFSDSGDLFHQITKCQKERCHLPETDVWRYIFGMCHGLKALHDMQILHRDMKCANVFLSTSGGNVIAKLGDFNVSKVAKRGLCMTQTGTPYYASPEVWRDMPYDAKSDMWSLGCVIYEMVALRPPFRAEDMEGLYRKVLRGQYPRIPSHFSNDLADVISVLLQVNPRHRPSVDQLLQMPIMQRHALESTPEYRASDLLGTIKLPKNAIDLAGCLPRPQYDINLHENAYDEVPHDAMDNIVDSVGKLPPRRRGPSIDEPTKLGMERRNYQDKDSLDTILSPLPHDVHKEAPTYTHSNGHGQVASADQQRQLPPIIQSNNQADSLDAYIQHQSKNRAAPRHPPPSNGHIANSVAEELRKRQASPAPSSVSRGAHYVGQRRSNDRKQMANYARPLYSIGGGAANSHASPPRQPSSAALRLPPIFSSAA
jgi:serine/threonine protein kinase